MKRDQNLTRKFSTLVDLLSWRALIDANRTALIFLQDGETDEIKLTYGELDERARAIGATLESLGAEGKRALLLYPPGLSFITGFLGCLYAGVVAVPTYPPHFNRPMPHLQAIRADAQATLILTTDQLLASAEGRLAHAPDLKNLRWLATDSLIGDPAAQWRRPEISGETLAFLQYTSGSTSSPRGVMVSHGNLLSNERMIQSAFEHTEESSFVVWLPMYHDMGLIGNLLQALYVGSRSVIMSPAAFLQKPYRWLNAISRYRATTSGAPNFAYDLCVDRISPEQKTSLDLSSWSLAFNGAEPVYHQTLNRFADAFEPCGFRREIFYPCYGLAEAAVFVSGGKKADPPVAQAFQKEALEQNRIIESSGADAERVLVGCGRTWLDQKIVIVNPDRLSRCTEHEVGEIWVSGSNIAQGYWNRAEETEHTFRARIPDTGEGPFLRTGDIGFLKDGELFITGRLKDLIIIRGRNHYPQDIEWTAEQSHPTLRQGASAAFPVEVAGEERLVIVAEVKRHFKNSLLKQVTDAIRQTVAEHHEVEVYAISLLKTGSIPKTSSGKIRRRTCRADFLARSLKTVGEWSQEVKQSDTIKNRTEIARLKGSLLQTQTVEAIQAWMISHIAELKGIDPLSINVKELFTNYGLDSAAATAVTGFLGDWLGCRLAPTLLYDYPTILSLSEHLADDKTSPRTRAAVEKREPDKEPVAIIGIGCRFPGANGPEAFWQLLRNGVDAITEVPADRWDSRAFYSTDFAAQGKMNTRWGGFLNLIDHFDAAFFNITPREAAQMDPQQRLLLEVAWEALDDAGQVPAQLSGTRTGVFIGVSNNEYAALQLTNPAQIDAYASTGGALSIAANRLSYFFDLRGPSMVIDTACSSSLVAVHLACRSLWHGESSLALVGGVNLILSPSVTISFSQAGAMSPDGRCKSFDAQANGIVRGEGVGVVVLKPLSRAMAEGDPIYAVIRGSAITQDGRSNGITAPSRRAQEAVLTEAYRDAGISPGRVQYIETHGTGTLLGDPIEAQALGSVIATDRDPGHYCAIGSVKTNIGHCEAAAGIAGLIKVALSIKHQAIPPSLHFQKPNPHIPFEKLQLRVQQSLSLWPDDAGPVVAGVSAFGFGGTNGHVVLEEVQGISIAPQQNGDDDLDRAYVLPISAHNAEALESVARSYKELLEFDVSDQKLSMKDICYTASLRRSHHDNRLAITARSKAEASERLDLFLQGETRRSISSNRVDSNRRRRLVFVFSGYGAQWPGMGRELLRQEPVFRASVEECDKLLRQYATWSLLEEWMADESQSRLDGSNVEITQVSLFALQVALAALWRSWGIEPEAVVGHSMGEAAAAHAAGILTLADAVRVIFHRGRLMQEQLEQLDIKGAMAAVPISLEEAQGLLAGYEDRLSVAVQNTPESVVLTGHATALEEVLESLKRRGVDSRVLRTPGAGHSPWADTVKKQLEHELEGLRPQPAIIPLFSTVTGRRADDGTLDAAYWGRNVREPVLFSRSVESLGKEGFDTFLELNPHPILLSLITQCLSHHKYKGIVMASLRRKGEDRAIMLESLGQLYTLGFPVDWRKLYPERSQFVRLPSLPWQRERFWLEDKKMRHLYGGKNHTLQYTNGGGHPILGRHVRSATQYGVHLWEMDLSLDRFPYLAEFRVRGQVLLSHALYLEMALAAAREAFGVGPQVLESVNFEQELVLADSESASKKVQLVISNGTTGAAMFQFFSFNPEATGHQSAWRLHASGKIRLED